MADKIKFLKIRDVKDPSRANQYDAGIDFFVPKFGKKFLDDLIEKNPQLFKDSKNNICIGTSSSTFAITNASNNNIISYDDPAKLKNGEDLFGLDPEEGQPYFLLLPHNRVMIPTGIKCRMAESGRAFIAANKSGVSTQTGIIKGAEIVDYTYKGEIHISIINTSTETHKIYQDKKLIQFLETPVFNSDIEVSTDSASIDFYKGVEDDRGEKGFGSSDKKD